MATQGLSDPHTRAPDAPMHRSPVAAYAFSPRLAFRVWQREATLYKRIWPSTILSNLFDPLVYLMAMGYGLGAYLQQSFHGVPYLQFIAPGLIASSVMMAATFEMAWNTWFRIYNDRHYEAMMTTPATLEDVVTGELMWATTRAGLYAAVMLLVLGPLGLLQSWWTVLVPFAGVLGGCMFAVLALTYTASRRRLEQLTFYFTLFITPMFLFSGIFFPLDRLPATVQGVAVLTPLYHLVHLMRGLVLGTVDVTLVWDVAYMVGLILIVWPLPRRVLARRLLT